VALTNRQRGDYFERQVRDTLRAHGWLVIRSAGSLGVADLVALRKGNTPTLVSCKLGGRIGPEERTAILDAADKAGARAVVAMRPRGGRVLLAAVMRSTSRLVPLDTLRVPPRERQNFEAVEA
jgi:Holliday junction resolvase